MQENLKTIILGSGPAGLTAALYAARAHVQPVVLAGMTPGGQLMQTTEVENFPGFVEGILGPELMTNMIKQAERFGAKILQETAVSVDFSKKPFSVKTEKAEYLADTVIVAMGAEANFLSKFANKVTVMHRREEFRASKIMLERAKHHPKISFVTNIEVLDVLG